MAPSLLMLMRNGGGRTATSCLVLLLLVLAVAQVRASSAVAVQDANEILIKPVAAEHMTITITPGLIIAVGSNGRTFSGTGAIGSGRGTGSLDFESPGMYAATAYFQVTNFHQKQHVLFQNTARITLGVWTGTFQPPLPASFGTGRFSR